MKSKYVRNNLVYHDGNRWYDAFGPNVVKSIDEFVAHAPELAAAGGASTSSDGWTITNTEAGGGDTTIAQIVDGLGGIIRITTDGAENDGANLGKNGESFTFTSAYPTYFGCRFQVSEATQSDFFFGLWETDTDASGGLTNGVYFRKIDGSTTMNFLLEKATVETATAYGSAIAASTWYTVEFFYNGTVVDWYVNGVLQTRPALTNLPNGAGVSLTVGIEFLTGEAVSHTCDIDWIKAIQIQQL